MLEFKIYRILNTETGEYWGRITSNCSGWIRPEKAKNYNTLRNARLAVTNRIPKRYKTRIEEYVLVKTMCEF